MNIAKAKDNGTELRNKIIEILFIRFMLDSIREKCQKQSEIGSKNQENPSSYTRAGGT